MVYDSNGKSVIPNTPIEPTGISRLTPVEFQEPLWRMKSLVERQLQDEHFWNISKGVLLNIGQCIADMMLIKFKIIASSLLSFE